MTVTFLEVTRDVGKWSDKQFGTGQSSIERLSGASEELGELEEAMWGADTAEVRDAIGDITIYLADYCYRSNLSVNVPLNEVRPQEEKLPPSTAQVTRYVGLLHHAHLKGLQGIRQDRNTTGEEAKREGVKNILGSLNLLCDYLGHDYSEVVAETMDEVLDREW
jgi:NTP pyrophosphatase (non-canonical NTP hydrolase)